MCWFYDKLNSSHFFHISVTDIVHRLWCVFAHAVFVGIYSVTDLYTQSMRTPRRVLVIHNPTAGWRRRRKFQLCLSALVDEGVDVYVRPTTKRGDAEAFARDANPHDVDVIAVAGGDGTINEAINGLADSSIALAIIPLGTANVLAHEIGLSMTPSDIAKTIAHGTPRPISLGVVNGRRFVMMAGFGFDAYVVSRVNPRIKRFFGKMAYVISTLRALQSFNFPKYRMSIDGERYDVASAVIANGHFYGGTFICAPDAKLNDPSLHVVLFLNPGVTCTIRYAIWLALGRLHRLPDVKIIPATDFMVEDVSKDPVQGDGDILAHLPARISLAPASLAVLMPG